MVCIREVRRVLVYLDIAYLAQITLVVYSDSVFIINIPVACLECSQ